MVVLSLGDFLWSLLVIFFMVVYFMMLFHVIVDVFRRKDASGGKKALWLLVLLIVPLVGLLAYMITNGEGMTARSVQDVQRSQQQFDERRRRARSRDFLSELVHQPDALAADVQARAKVRADG